jgi:hypothetical protein
MSAIAILRQLGAEATLASGGGLGRKQGCRQTANTLEEPVQTLGSGRSGRLFFWSVTEACLYHLPGRGGEAVGAGIVHGDEAKCLGERNAIGPGLQKFDLGVHSPENRVQGYVAHGSMWYGALGKYGRTTGEGETLNYANEPGSVHSEERALAVGNANARGSGPFARFLRLPHHPRQHGKWGGCGQDYRGAARCPVLPALSSCSLIVDVNRRSRYFFSNRNFFQRAFCAAAIRLRPATDILPIRRRPLRPNFSSARTAWCSRPTVALASLSCCLRTATTSSRLGIPDSVAHHCWESG